MQLLCSIQIQSFTIALENDNWLTVGSIEELFLMKDDFGIEQSYLLSSDYHYLDKSWGGYFGITTVLDPHKPAKAILLRIRFDPDVKFSTLFFWGHCDSSGMNDFPSGMFYSIKVPEEIR